ncbi:MAG: 30S ribosomal protein S18 [Candidatus Omnitrophica bacterium]|nr:30S ribosomal protein S18 [Candidatus Omnitrophota bacterium]
MAERSERRSEPGEKRGRQKFFKKKTCKFCSEKVTQLDFKDTDRIMKFLTEKGKIIPRRISGNCAKHQRRLAAAVKRSRHAAIVPFQTS